MRSGDRLDHGDHAVDDDLAAAGGGKTLNANVKDVLSHSRELLPDNKRCVKEPCRKPRGVCGRPDSTEAGDGGVLRQLRV